MAAAKRSGVWKYFEKDDEEKVRCKICEGTLVFHKSTSSMLNHMRLKHKENTLETDESQQRITRFMPAATTRTCDDKRAEKINILITKMVTGDMLPLSFVEGDGFFNLMEFVEPEYEPPARKTLTTRVEKMYEESATELKADLQHAEKVAITSDSWTALTTESYVTITCHYISSQSWELKTTVLQTRRTDERHTAENIAHHLRAATEEWGVLDKVCACVHDNASNMVLANQRLLQWESVPCFAHTLQLAINDGFKVASVNRVVGAASKLVSHFHHSTVATAGLKRKQAEQNLDEHKLIQYCRTRWNSVFEMFERLLKQRWAVSATLSDRQITKLTDARTLELTDDNWQTMEDILPALQALKCATTVLCSESHVCLSMVHPTTACLLSRHLVPQAGESAKVTEFKTAVASSLKKRVSPNSTTDPGKAALIASALDPRHKHLRFIEPALRVSIRERLTEMYDSLPEEEPSASTREMGDLTEPEERRPAAQITSAVALETLFGEDYHTAGAEADGHNELDQYFKEPCITPEKNPLQWWKSSETRYKKLSVLAKQYLSIPATSVPAERVFSTAGLILNRLRTRLSPEHVDMLVFLNKNNKEKKVAKKRKRQ